MAQQTKQEEAKSQRGRFQEARTAQSGKVEVVVDGDTTTLKNVLLVGKTSRNRADYSDAALQAGVRLYEEAEVFVGHSKDGSNPSFDRSMGVIRNPVLAADGIRGDHTFPSKHRLAEDLVWRAHHAPRNIGYSHDADCTYTVNGRGRRQVNAIEKVYSVDLVTRPATTGGLAEEEETVPEEQRDFAEHVFSFTSDVRSLVLNQSATLADKRARLAEAMRALREELNAPEAAADGATLKEETQSMEWKDITLETLTANCPDLVAKLKGTDDMSRLTEEVKTLKASEAAKDAELAALKAKDAARLKEDEILGELKAAGVATDSKLPYFARFMEDLRGAADKTARAPLIADWKELTKARMQEQHVGTPAPLADLRPDPAPTVNTAAEERFFGK